MTPFQLANPFLDHTYQKRCEELQLALMKYLPLEKIQSVVDLGCGIGDISKFLRELGKEVWHVDGRMEHLQGLMDDGERTIMADAHTLLNIKADLVLCLGLLYHSANPRQILENCFNIAPMVVVETTCLDSDKYVLVIEEEISTRHDQSLNGWGSVLSPSWITQTLESIGYTTILDLSAFIPDIKPSVVHRGSKYNWDIAGSGNRSDRLYGFRRIWIASTNGQNRDVWNQ